MRLHLTLLKALVAISLFCSVPIIIRWLSPNAYGIGFVRIICASVCATAVALYRKEFGKLVRSDWRVLVLLGLVFGVHWLCFFLGVKLSSASLAVLGQATFGVQLIVLGWFFGLNRVVWLDIVGIVLALTGAVIVAPELTIDSSKTIGLILAVLSATLFAILPIIHQKNRGLSGFVRTWGQFTFAVPVFVMTYPWATFTADPIEWAYLLYLGIVVTMVGHFLWIEVATELPTTLTSVLSYLDVPIIMMLSWMILGEEIHNDMIVGAAFILVGNAVTLVYHRSADLSQSE